MNADVIRYRKRREARLRKRRFDAAEDEGRWITTENGHKVHINEEGVPDKGNPYVLKAMTGEADDHSKSRLKELREKFGDDGKSKKSPLHYIQEKKIAKMLESENPADIAKAVRSMPTGGRISSSDGRFSVTKDREAILVETPRGVSKINLGADKSISDAVKRMGAGAKPDIPAKSKFMGGVTDVKNRMLAIGQAASKKLLPEWETANAIDSNVDVGDSVVINHGGSVDIYKKLGGNKWEKNGEEFASAGVGGATKALAREIVAASRKGSIVGIINDSGRAPGRATEIDREEFENKNRYERTRLGIGATDLRDKGIRKIEKDIEKALYNIYRSKSKEQAKEDVVKLFDSMPEGTKINGNGVEIVKGKRDVFVRSTKDGADRYFAYSLTDKNGLGKLMARVQKEKDGEPRLVDVPNSAENKPIPEELLADRVMPKRSYPARLRMALEGKSSDAATKVLNDMESGTQMYIKFAGKDSFERYYKRVDGSWTNGKYIYVEPSDGAIGYPTSVEYTPEQFASMLKESGTEYSFTERGEKIRSHEKEKEKGIVERGFPKTHEKYGKRVSISDDSAIYDKQVNPESKEFADIVLDSSLDRYKIINAFTSSVRLPDGKKWPDANLSLIEDGGKLYIEAKRKEGKGRGVKADVIVERYSMEFPSGKEQIITTKVGPDGQEKKRTLKIVAPNKFNKVA